MEVQWTDMQSCVVVGGQPTMLCLVFDSAVSRLRSRVMLSHKENNHILDRSSNSPTRAETPARRILDSKYLSIYFERDILLTPSARLSLVPCRGLAVAWLVCGVRISPFSDVSGCFGYSCLVPTALLLSIHHVIYSVPLAPQSLTSTGRTPCRKARD
jgi:hypothetical protein